MSYLAIKEKDPKGDTEIIRAATTTTGPECIGPESSAVSIFLSKGRTVAHQSHVGGALPEDT